MTAHGDFLVIGSGVAGLRAALGLADAGQVIVLTKADPGESNTGYAQGGIAAALGDDDSPALHAHDTMAAGDQLCVPEAVRVLVDDGRRYVHELVDWGARFDRDSDGRLALGREAAHTGPRITWEQMWNATQDLAPDTLKMGDSFPIAPVPVPGVHKLA